SAGRGSEVVFSLRDAVVERGDVRLGPVNLTVATGERVRLTGPNGSGKSTLLGALLGRIPLRSGARYVGPGVVVGELEQARDALRGPEPLLEVFRRLAAPAGARPSAALNSGWPGAAPAPGRPGAAPTPGRSGALPAPGSAGGLSPVEARTLLAKFR